MSLINDALKTAQRERGGSPTGSGGPPLLEGFFPYVSTGSAAKPPRNKLVVVGLAVLVSLVIIVGLLMVYPRIKGKGPTRMANAPIVLPPRPVPVTPSKPVATPSATVDNAPSRTSSTVAANPPADRVSAPAVSPMRAAPRPALGEAKSVVLSADPRSARSDTAIARPGIAAAQPPASRVESPSASRVDYEAQATVLFNAGDFAGAKEKFMLASRLAPTARAWTNYGVTLQKLGDLEGAGSAYQSAIGIDASYLEAWLFQGRLAVRMGDPQRAVPLFQRARAINPRHSEVNTELAELQANSKNWTEARRFAEDAVRADVSNSRAHWFLAISTDQLGEFDVATREYAAYLQTIGTAERDNAQPVGWARTRLEQLRRRP